MMAIYRGFIPRPRPATFSPQSFIHPGPGQNKHFDKVHVSVTDTRGITLHSHPVSYIHLVYTRFDYCCRAMLTLVTTILCVVCYCCHRNIKKRTEAAYRQQQHQWLEGDPNMEIYSVEQVSFGFSSSISISISISISTPPHPGLCCRVVITTYECQTHFEYNRDEGLFKSLSISLGLIKDFKINMNKLYSEEYSSDRQRLSKSISRFKLLEEN